MMIESAPWTDFMGLAASVARTAIRHPPAGKAENPQGQGSDHRKCYTCERRGHMKNDCRARTKANGEKIVRNPEKKKTFGKETDNTKTGWKGKGSVRTQAEVTDEEDEPDDEDFLGEEGDSEKE